MDANRKENKITGNRGEELTAEYLSGLGYKIIERNLRLSVGEIDILAQDKRTIVIVEVKTVRGEGFGLAQELVRYKKQEKLKLLARAIIQKYPTSTIRIDVIGVDLSNPSEPKFEHLVNAVNWLDSSLRWNDNNATIEQSSNCLYRALMQKYPDSHLRIDVIGVDLSDFANPKFEHLVNAVN